MKKYIVGIVCATLMVFLTACTTIPEYVTPKLNVQQGLRNIGHGKKIAVAVYDSRADSRIGVHVNVVGIGPQVSINLTNGSMDVIYGAVSKGLVSRGFRTIHVSQHNSLSTKMDVKLVRLSYEDIPSPFGSVEVGSTLMNSMIYVDATANGMHYRKTYRVSLQADFPFADTKERDKKLVSAVLTKNINRMFFDKQLMSFLAK